MNETSNISGRCHGNYFAPSLGNKASEDPNLPIDDHRKVILPYKQ